MAKGNGGVVSAPPISSTAALRKLEKAYAAQGKALEAATKALEAMTKKYNELKERK